MLQYWSMAWPVQLLRDDPLHLAGRLFDANIFHPYPHTLAYTDHLLGATLLNQSADENYMLHTGNHVGFTCALV